MNQSIWWEHQDLTNAVGQEVEWSQIFLPTNRMQDALLSRINRQWPHGCVRFWSPWHGPRSQKWWCPNSVAGNFGVLCHVVPTCAQPLCVGLHEEIFNNMFCQMEMKPQRVSWWISPQLFSDQFFFGRQASFVLLVEISQPSQPLWCLGASGLCLDRRWHYLDDFQMTDKGLHKCFFCLKCSLLILTCIPQKYTMLHWEFYKSYVVELCLRLLARSVRFIELHRVQAGGRWLRRRSMWKTMVTMACGEKPVHDPQSMVLGA